ncbi:Histone chaperone RTT106, partial [Frankliniella fusca]
IKKGRVRIRKVERRGERASERAAHGVERRYAGNLLPHSLIALKVDKPTTFWKGVRCRRPCAAAREARGRPIRPGSRQTPGGSAARSADAEGDWRHVWRRARAELRRAAVSGGVPVPTPVDSSQPTPPTHPPCHRGILPGCAPHVPDKSAPRKRIRWPSS